MKKILILPCIALIAVALACNNPSGTDAAVSKKNDTTAPYKISLEDSTFMIRLNMLMNKSVEFHARKDEPIDVDLAAPCIAKYEQTHGIPPAGSSVLPTTAISFLTPEFKRWLATDVGGNTNLIVVELGVYTRELIAAINSDPDPRNDLPADYEGRVTVFISPYERYSKTDPNDRARAQMGGAVIKPYNLGSLYP